MRRGDAGSILAAAREALGGEKKLSEVKSFVATGRTRQVRGNNLVPIEFEILCELPDKYLRKDEIPAQESEPTSSGFNGDALIQIPPPAETPTGGANPLLRRRREAQRRLNPPRLHSRQRRHRLLRVRRRQLQRAGPADRRPTPARRASPL